MLIRGIFDLVLVVFLFGILIIFFWVLEVLVIIFNGLVRFVNYIKGFLGMWNDDFLDDFMIFYGIVLLVDVIF